MTIKQISVFLENTAGHAGRLVAVLEKAAVSVRGFSLADTGQFGIARFVVDDPPRACEALTAAGFAVSVGEILCVELIDRPGELARILSICASAGLNIEYAYSLVSTYVAFKVADNQQAVAQLAPLSLRLVDQAEIAAFKMQTTGGGQ